LEYLSSAAQQAGTSNWMKPSVFVRKEDSAMLHASNFSIGVNIFFEINALLAKLMSSQNAYEPMLKEVHHTQKLDAPSGTASRWQNKY
jgi:4-hydroxy-tetrahydrodipicolinate reductase